MFKINQSVEQMQDTDTFQFKGVSFAWGKGPGNVGIGASLSFDNVPEWFSDAHPGFRKGERASYVLPWCVIGFGKENTASEAFVEMRNWEMFFLQKGVWKKVNGSNYPSGAFYDKIGGNLTSGTDWNKRSPVKILKDHLFHGWTTFASVPANEVEAIACSVEMRTLDSNAEIVADIGADAYPANKKAERFAIPGIMINRPVHIGREWTFLSAVTFSNAGKQEPGGGITTGSFKNNPPKWTNLPGLKMD